MHLQKKLLQSILYQMETYHYKYMYIMMFCFTDACYFGESIVIRRGGDVDSNNIVVKFESVYSIIIRMPASALLGKK